jgi:hypothetical protein
MDGHVVYKFTTHAYSCAHYCRCYNIINAPIHIPVHHATILHTRGVDHGKLTYKFQGTPLPRLTDVSGTVVHPILGMTAEGRADRRAGA